MLINIIISSILEIAVVSLIPFLLWLITSKKKENFFHWIGLKGMEAKEIKGSMWEFTIISIGYILVSVFVLFLTKDIETATSAFSGLGIGGILPALVYSIFNTSLPEEILFRGFLLKNFQNRFGYKPANIIQSVIFGLLHGAMFLSAIGIVKAIVLVLFTGAFAYFMGYINEKKAGGSIIPSWIIHALSNIVASFMALFSVI